MPKETTDPLKFLSSVRKEEPPDNETEDQKKARLEIETQDAAKKKLDDDKKKEADSKAGDKDLNTAALKAKKIALEKEVEDLKKQITESQELKPLSKIAEYLKQKEGKVDEESVNKFIEKGKERKKQLLDLDGKYKEKDAKLKEIDITLSDEWVENFAKPIAKASDSLTATLANIDNEGKIKHPELIEEFKQLLIQTDKEGKPRTSVQIKALTQKFADKYHELTKEEYEVPRINDIVDSVNSLVDGYVKAVTTKSNWNEYLKERQKEKAFEKAKQEEVLTRKELEGRQYMVNKVIEDFDYKSLEGIVEKDEVEEIAKKHHDFFTKLAKGEEKSLGYDTIIAKITKADLYDKLVEENKKLRSDLANEKKKSKSGLPADSLDPTIRKNSDDHKPDARIGKAPLDFLKT